MWNPEIKFENALKYEQTKPYGGDSTFVFWLVYGTSTKSYEMHYGEEFQITFHCQFHLATYPFDSHECLLYFGDERYESSEVKFNPISIYYNMDETSDGVEPIIIDYSSLPFEFQLQSVATKEKDAGYNISYTGMLVRIKRKSLGLLLSGYYYPSASFAFLSMISFLINPDVVSQTF